MCDALYAYRRIISWSWFHRFAIGYISCFNYLIKITNYSYGVINIWSIKLQICIHIFSLASTCILFQIKQFKHPRWVYYSVSWDEAGNAWFMFGGGWGRYDLLALPVPPSVDGSKTIHSSFQGITIDRIYTPRLYLYDVFTYVGYPVTIHANDDWSTYFELVLA